MLWESCKKFLLVLISRRSMVTAYDEGMYILASAGMLLFLTGWMISIYQRLSHYHGGAMRMWQELEAEVKHRHELLTRLTQLTSVCISEEPPLLRALADDNEADFLALREKDIMCTPLSMERFGEREEILQRTLEGFFLSLDERPDLKKELPVSRLRHELSISATRVNRALYVYNAAAREYNASLASFPGSMVAQLCRFRKAASL